MSHLREHDANTGAETAPQAQVEHRAKGARSDARPLSPQLMPVMFRNGLDRRSSARIPLSGAVRMGPPSGDPYAAVSARDVSAGGLFIDADRPVKIGARFSAELMLGNGERLYVPEAEVAYNREHANGSGFGVRFVDPPAELVEAIEREIETTREAVARVPSLPPVSTFEVLDSESIAPEVEVKAPSVKPAPVKPVSIKPMSVKPAPAKIKTRQKDENATEIVVRDTLPPLPREPMIGDDTFDVESSMPEAVPAWWEDWMRVGHDLKTRVLERSRRVPVLWTVLATTGSVLVVSAIGLALWSGTRAEAVEPVAAIDRGVTAGTHQALMGDHQMPDVVIPKRVAAALEPVEAKKPLPPLVYVEEVEKKAVAAAEQKPVQKTIEEPKPAAKSVAKAEVKAVAKPVAATKPAAKPSRDLRTKIALAPNARVLKTHVLRAPDRFVIDVAGQDKIPALPGSTAQIKSVRFGKHPDFARIVIETNGPIDNGRASKKGAELAVAIELR